MMYAVVRDGVVINVVEWDGTTYWPIPEGCEVINIQGTEYGIGWLYSDGVFTRPETMPPSHHPDHPTLKG
jgi:hypothetical protein